MLPYNSYYQMHNAVTTFCFIPSLQILQTIFFSIHIQHIITLTYFKTILFIFKKKKIISYYSQRVQQEESNTLEGLEAKSKALPMILNSAALIRVSSFLGAPQWWKQAREIEKRWASGCSGCDGASSGRQTSWFVTPNALRHVLARHL